MSLLRAEGLNKHFGGLHAIRDLSFEVQQGQCFGIIGANGAGKTTLLNLMTGYIPLDTGRLYLDGRAITRTKPYRLCAMGMARTFQIVQPFAEMTVLENVVTGALFSGRNSERGVAAARRRCMKLLDLVGLQKEADALAGTLTIGGKKKLELARALATRPKLLLLDEVMGGLTQGEIETCSATLERIRGTGITIVMIEHHVHVITRLCDRVLVLDFGARLYEGTPADVVAHPDVIQAYLGKPLEKLT